jgi:hypothetical protein
MRWTLAGVLAVAVAAAVSPHTTARAVEPNPFVDVARVLQSPRCLNCHPDGDRPLQRDDGRFHAQYVSRRFEALGGKCSSCHMPFNLDGAHLPPGAPNWHLPPRSMAFQNRTVGELCRQLKDRSRNGGKTPEQLLHHVREDALVKWGWSPGAGRKVPPLSHASFVQKFAAWVEQGTPCPE